MQMDKTMPGSLVSFMPDTVQEMAVVRQKRRFRVRKGNPYKEPEPVRLCMARAAATLCRAVPPENPILDLRATERGSRRIYCTPKRMEGCSTSTSTCS